MAEVVSASSTSRQLIEAFGYEEVIERLKSFLVDWVDHSDPEVKELLDWQFVAESKYFRPVTIFACHQAVSREPIDEQLIRAAAAVEIVHNMSLIVDDILDRSRYRRGKLTLHCRAGTLPALMTAGYITACSFQILKSDSYGIELIGDLIKRLGAAECLQWRLRRQPLGVEDWRQIAGEDTGTMFETCACFGARGEKLRLFGRLLGVVYHGCDDVGDVRGAVALGGGGEEDLRDGIVTLPVAIAIRDPEVAVEFRRPTKQGLEFLMEKTKRALPKAEQYLDQIAEEAAVEARSRAQHPDPLLMLVEHTRQLSRL